MRLILIFIFIPFLALGQSEIPFKTLIAETNNYLNQYSRLSANGDEYFAISSFGLSKKDREELIEEAKNKTLTQNKDSVLSTHMIGFFQTKITDRINQIIKSPDFKKYDLKKLITSDELSIVVSEDNKLFNFSISDKFAGSYQSRISIMHYNEHDLGNQKSDFNSFFSPDGYSNIYLLKSDEGTKYVLTGNVRKCSYCFESFVRLISFKNNKFSEEFMYTVESRDWNGGVTYNHQTKTINVDYNYDDISPNCKCSDNSKDNEWHDDMQNVFDLNCSCKYVFNGNHFDLVKGKSSLTIGERENISETLSFRITKNQKEVKVLVVNGETLYYVFLKDNSLVEFSYPIKEISQNKNFRINKEKDKLTFNNGNIIYQIYNNKVMGKSVDIGVLVTVNGKAYDLKGDLNSLKGSLSDIKLEKLNNVDKE